MPHEYARFVCFSTLHFPDRSDRNIELVASNGCLTLADISSVSSLQVAYMEIRNEIFSYHIPYVPSFDYIKINAGIDQLCQAYRKRYLEIHEFDNSCLTGNHGGWFWSLSISDRLALKVEA